MKLACNYYPETEALVREGRIDIDYFKFPALGFQMDILNDRRSFAKFSKQVTAVKPILLHGVYPGMKRLLRQTKSPGISLHPELVKPSRPEHTYDLHAIIEKIKRLQKRYRRLDFISIENEPNANPEHLADIVREVGCKFLLDISHAYVSARHYGEDLWAYLARLPLDHVYEIHINGWVEKDGDIMCHVKINEEGYEILEELLQRCQPKIITIEYGRHNDRIGCGCPVIRPDDMNRQAMEEITEQVGRIRKII